MTPPAAADAQRRCAGGLLAAVLLGSGAVAPAVAGPGELTVLSVAPLRDALGAVVADYERSTGRRVALTYAAPARLATSLKGTDHPDLLVLAEDAFATLAGDSHAAVASRVPLARTGLGVAVRQGAATPDVSTPAAFRQALLGARSLAYLDPAEQAAGRQAEEVVTGLGLAETVKPRTRLGTGESAVGAVGSGDVELGVYPVNQILAASGVHLAGALPAELQRWTRYDVALLEDAPNASEARDLMRYLAGPVARAALAAKGFHPPAP